MSERTPVVSVVIPTRNRLAYLREAVSSVRKQTLRPVEVVVVDDVSDDGTRRWLTESRDEVLRAVLLDEHGERSVARNRGLSEAAGRYVLFLDDDDLLTPDALEALVAACCRHPGARAAVGAMVEFDSNGNRRRDTHPRRTRELRAWPDAAFDWKANPGRVLYVTQSIRELGGFAADLAGSEDLDLWLRVAQRWPVVLVPSVVLEARLHAGQTVFADAAATFDAVVARRFAATDPVAGPDAERMRAARAAYLRANDSLSQLDGRAALRQLVGAVRVEPRVLTSPIVRPRMLRAFGKSLVGAVAGRRGLRSARRLVGRARALARKDAWRTSEDESAR